MLSGSRLFQNSGHISLLMFLFFQLNQRPDQWKSAIKNVHNINWTTVFTLLWLCNKEISFPHFSLIIYHLNLFVIPNLYISLPFRSMCMIFCTTSMGEVDLFPALVMKLSCIWNILIMICHISVLTCWTKFQALGFLEWFVCQAPMSTHMYQDSFLPFAMWLSLSFCKRF